MARRKKTTKRKTTRRRRVSGVGSLNPTEILTQVGGVLVGVAAAGYLNKLALANKSRTIQMVVPLAAGALLPMVLKSKFAVTAGAGMIAYGGAKFLASVGLGDAGNSYDVPISVNGAGDLSIMAGDENDFAMAGDENDFAMAGDDYLTSLAGSYIDEE